MRVLTIFAHSGSRSFCHAVLEQFTRGLADAGHTSEVVDLYAIDFDPVLRDRDWPNWIDESIPDDQLERLNLEKQIEDSARGPLQRLLVKARLYNKDARSIIRLLHQHRPKDVAIQQAKVARADALAFIAPIYFVGFPAILKGWIERVFTLGFAFGMSPEGWRGEISGRRPLLKHEKALIMSTTLFDEASYASGLGDAIRRLVDEFCLRYPGIKAVEHVYFYSVGSVDDATRRSYLERAYLLGKNFAEPQKPRATDGPSKPATHAHL